MRPTTHLADHYASDLVILARLRRRVESDAAISDKEKGAVLRQLKAVTEFVRERISQETG